MAGHCSLLVSLLGHSNSLVAVIKRTQSASILAADRDEVTHAVDVLSGLTAYPAMCWSWTLRDQQQLGCFEENSTATADEECALQPLDQCPESSFVWRHGLVRPATSSQQARDFVKALLTEQELQHLVPGWQPAAGTSSSGAVSQQGQGEPPAPEGAVGAQQQSRRARRQQQRQALAIDASLPAGLLIPDGLVLDVPRYLTALWAACRDRAAQAANTSSAQLHTGWACTSLRAFCHPPPHLLAGAAAAWSPARSWAVGRVSLPSCCACVLPPRRSGVRGLPPRTPAGSVPLLGRLPAPYAPEATSAAPPSFWVIAGLGARGLVWHAWLADRLARAVLSGEESDLPRDCTEWQRAGSRAPRFEDP
ncbi:uncharacterized protein HaLaN_14395 [Haematococcus lacustris]|uniref:FAD dependent oxidoreductase domain-containing protein n=1 Tax=Haematococcus lacustris TaxID=44745 RepID=A0A699ZFU6_HAELA|nr:uncharacterized protein HaLaN_14395 [Haematococcus lacustris]